MTILVDWQIRHAIETKHIGVSYYDPSLINPNSLDLRLGSPILRYDALEKSPIDPFDQDSIMAGLVEHPFYEKFIFEPGDTILATTLEVIVLPPDICAELNGKSSVARLFIDIHKTGGWIDCGFMGQITLEMENTGKRPVILYRGMKIGQLVFHHTALAEQHYGERAGSKYHGQTGPTVSKYHLNGEQNDGTTDSDRRPCSDDQQDKRPRQGKLLPGDNFTGGGKSRHVPRTGSIPMCRRGNPGEPHRQRMGSMARRQRVVDAMDGGSY